MIIRDHIACETCGHLHVVRIGVGYEEYQPYKFPCKGCGESICIALNMGHGILLEENAIRSDAQDGDVINLDSFLLSNPSHDGLENLKQRVEQSHEYLTIQKQIYEEKHGKGSFESALLNTEPQKQILITDEWKLLKKCWSLHLRNRDKLANKKITEINKELYDYDPVGDFYDWLWRFSTRLSGSIYDDLFEKAINSITASCQENSELQKFTDLLRKGLLEEHLQIYFDLFKQFFERYQDFNQVYLYCSTGMNIPKDHQASSQDFDKISSFYGNAFEAFTTLAEVLACVNNVIAGRSFDQFEEMTLKKYKQLDKSSRCNPFLLNPHFSNLCKNVDNQLRNSSHHGGLRFDQESSVIRYRAGKGGNGQEHEITYTNYLLQCTNLFLAITVLLRMELAMHEHM